KNETAHFPITNLLAEEFSSLFAAGIEHTVDPAFLLQLRGIHSSIEFYFRSVLEHQQVRTQHSDSTADAFQAINPVPDDCGGSWCISGGRLPRYFRLRAAARTILKEKRTHP